MRISLGGIRDEAEIRGHRKTYIGSMPGRIIASLKLAGSMNPVILLDEVDKLTMDAHGDPTSALLEVLDTDQNKQFRDHFIELPVDLSECLFIATANTVETIPAPLLDRMEVIDMDSYSDAEKLSIAKNHLISKQLKRHGLTRRNLSFTDRALQKIISGYTKESGVRNLEREIASVCRKVARDVVSNGIKTHHVDENAVMELLGPEKFLQDRIYPQDEVGIVNGLAWTSLGGELLRVEVLSMQGTGNLELTGHLGDVMKESAKAAVSYIRKHAETLGIDPGFYKTRDIHIHVPEGAIPKDGPSAGIAMTTAIISELSGRPVRQDVAMTGEITLTGRVLQIGGLKEKSMAAYKAGRDDGYHPARQPAGRRGVRRGGARAYPLRRRHSLHRGIRHRFQKGRCRHMLMQIGPLNLHNAALKLTAGAPAQLLKAGKPQIAFAGRSNVGKAHWSTACLDAKSWRGFPARRARRLRSIIMISTVSCFLSTCRATATPSARLRTKNAGRR